MKEIFAHHVRKNMLDMEYALAEIKGLESSTPHPDSAGLYRWPGLHVAALHDRRISGE
ncbi:hypothetical protein WDV93_04490 [Pantoea ananatis]